MTQPETSTTQSEIGGNGRRVPRGGARDALVAAVHDMLDEVTLDDLTAFVTVSRLTERTGLSAGSIYSAFRSEADSGRASSAPRAVAREALIGQPFDSNLVDLMASVLREALDRAELRPGDLLPAEVADLVAVAVVSAARSPEYTRSSLVLAGCLGDVEVAERMRADYLVWERLYTELTLDLLDRSGREPVDGLKAGDLARSLLAAADGAAQRVRCDPDLGNEFVRHLVLGLWAGLTRPVGDEDDLLERRVSGPLVVELSGDEQAAIATAVRRVNDTAGWQAVTLRKVAQLSGVPVGRVARAFPDRDHFSLLLWDDLLAGIERRAATDRSDPWSRLDSFLHDLADVACANRRLTGSMLTVRLARGPDTDDGDSVVGRLIEIVRRIMDADPDAGEPYDEPATMLVESLLVRAASSDIRADLLARTILGHVH